MYESTEPVSCRSKYKRYLFLITCLFFSNRQHEEFVLMCLRMIYNHLRLAVVGSLCALRHESTNLRNALFRLIDQDAPESVKEVL